MFEFITISNGVVVVQHTPSGHVYRFRPKLPGLWESLTLTTIDGRDDAHLAAEHQAAACSFAEHAAAQCSTTADWPNAAVTEGRRIGALRRAVTALRGR